MRLLVSAASFLVLWSCAIDAGDGDAAQADRGARLQATMDDPEAARLFASVLDSIAPDDGWQRTRYIAFDRISGAGVGRSHRWDRYEGEYWLRAQTGGSEMVARFNANHPAEGQEIWLDGERVDDPELADELVESAYRMFINDTYWLVFPFKWDDPGVTARYLGELEVWGETFEGVELTFDDVGLTPQNRYRALVDPETGMFELWQFFGDAGDSVPRFTHRWTQWERYGPILLSAGRATEDGSVGVRFENVTASTEVPPGAFEGP